MQIRQLATADGRAQLGTLAQPAAGYSPKHVAFWKHNSYQGLSQGPGVGYTVEHEDRRASNSSDPWEREVNFLLELPTTRTLQVPVRTSDKEYCTETTVAGLDLTVNNIYCKDQTSKSAPVESPPADSDTSQGSNRPVI